MMFSFMYIDKMISSLDCVDFVGCSVRGSSVTNNNSH